MTMAEQLAGSFYRLALSSAAQRDLTRAAWLAHFACGLDGSHENAAKLLKLCQYELGSFGAGHESGFERIRALAKQKKWREAARLARSLPRRSVRALNIQACALACAKRYKPAARAFSEALEKDRGNKTAAAGLAEATSRQSGFWGFA